MKLVLQRHCCRGHVPRAPRRPRLLLPFPLPTRVGACATTSPAIRRGSPVLAVALSVRARPAVACPAEATNPRSRAPVSPPGLVRRDVVCSQPSARTHPRSPLPPPPRPRHNHDRQTLCAPMRSGRREDGRRPPPPAAATAGDTATPGRGDRGRRHIFIYVHHSLELTHEIFFLWTWQVCFEP